ncbi:hypothetical protein ACFSUD_10470 [Sulfitobacter aestuarii]|uniref:Ion channel n=1 Tax=Sulfitobacter aestuarii TaxID=2161676 RepID=A0ABW5U2W2_9RHOB
MTLADAILGVMGVVLLVGIVADFLLTTIGASYHALLSHHVANYTWRIFTAILPDRPGARVYIGPIVMTGVAAFWIFGTSLAWAMVFQFDDRAIVRMETGAPASWWMDLAYIGHLLSTLGGSLGKPGDIGWSLAAVLVAVNGMVILTLSVSFVLNTTQTVAEARAFLATSEALEDRFTPHHGIAAQLANLVANLNAVPLALYYSSPNESRRVPGGLTALFEKTLKNGDAAAIRVLRRLLAGLPRFDPKESEDDAGYLKDLRRWSKAYEF